MVRNEGNLHYKTFAVEGESGGDNLMREDVCWKVDEHDVTKVRENIPNKKRKTMKR